MDYEKAYYSLIERLKEAKEDDTLCDERYCCVIDGLIQEQEECEDEKIRKAIKRYVLFLDDTFPDKDSWLAWLEKQEQKPADKAEPKFKIEDAKWYVCTQTFILRGKTVVIEGQIYQSHQNNTITGENGCLFVDKHDGIASEYFRPWSIKDAKDGDVLYSPTLKLLWIYKSRDTVYCGCNLNYNDGAICGEGYFERPTDAIPATKEQYDLFFQKMKEAGYRWNPTEKRLEEIEGGKESESKKEEKAYNTEECNCIIQDTISICEQARKNATNEIDYENATRCIGWLKILKYRHTWKPSKEQMNTLLFISSVLQDKQVIVNLEELKTLYNDLKKL